MQKRTYAGFLRNEHGIAAIEAALILPVFLFLLIGAVELYQYFRAQAIVERTAYEVAQSLSLQDEAFDKETICQYANQPCIYYDIAKKLMKPLDFERYGGLAIAVYTVEQEENGDNVLWRLQDGWPVKRGDDPPEAVLPRKDGQPHETIVTVHVAYKSSGLRLTSQVIQALAGTEEIIGTAYLRTRGALRGLKPMEP